MPDHDLPKFEGRVPDAAAVTFTGGQEGTPPHIDAYRHSQPVAFLVIGEVGDITHGDKGGEKDRRYVRSHKIVVEKVIPLDAEEAARIYNNAVERLNEGTPGTLLEGLVDEIAESLGEGTSMTVSTASGKTATVKGKGRRRDPDEAPEGPEPPDEAAFAEAARDLDHEHGADE